MLTSHVLVLHEFHGVLALLIGRFGEILLHVLERNIITIEEERLCINTKVWKTPVKSVHGHFFDLFYQ